MNALFALIFALQVSLSNPAFVDEVAYRPAAAAGECTLLVEQTSTGDYAGAAANYSQKLKLTDGTQVCKFYINVRIAGGDKVTLTFSSLKTGGGTVYGTSSEVALSSTGWVEITIESPITVGTDPWVWVEQTEAVGTTQYFFVTGDGTAYEDTNYYVAEGDGTDRTTWDLTFQLHTVQ
jgi:hypothetical protein